jgi:hypothetical protein
MSLISAGSISLDSTFNICLILNLLTPFVYRVWTPVFGKDDQQTTDEDDDEKHPSIIKNGVMETDLNVSRCWRSGFRVKDLFRIRFRPFK